jgi:hypothetical protein
MLSSSILLVPKSALAACHLDSDLSSAFSQFRYAGILPIAKVLKRDRVMIRFVLHAQQNDERSAERAGIED